MSTNTKYSRRQEVLFAAKLAAICGAVILALWLLNSSL